MSELILSDTSFLRVWVNTETPLSWNIAFDGMRALHENQREIWEYTSIGNGSFHVDIIYSNQTCMRNIEVVVLDEGHVRLI